MPKIAPNSIVDPRAELDTDVEVGPFCTIGAGVRVGPGTRLISHVVLAGRTTIGKRNTIHPFAVLGNYPQDLKYKGEPTGLEIGDDNHFREHVTVHCGTVYGSKISGGGITRLGDGNLLMVNAHVGHDCQIGSRCIIANNVMLAGHVVVGNNVVMNGAAGVNAWVTIGDFAYIGGAARIHHDVPPYVKVSDKDCIRALNSVGLRRAGFADDDIHALDTAARRLFVSKRPLSITMAEYDTANGINQHVRTMIEFLRRRDSGKFGRYLESLR
jgi:UDP-N-acetylglucosamine acyltransferase